MLYKAKHTLYTVLANPNMRTWFILTTILIAALASGAPSDYGGEGG